MRAIILLGVLCSLLSAQPREALLIGNHNYEHISDLDNPSKNLQRLKASLEEVDFNVKVETDLNSENLENAIEQFKNRLARSSNTIGFLYYTGHGCQVDYQGYLVPTNVDTKSKLKIKYNALNINQMLENLKGAGNKVNLLFLDACRDVPTGTKGGTKGLGQPTNTPNASLVVYATKAGEVANDNSYFIDALIQNIKIPNQTIRDLGDNISLSVAQKSSKEQIPVVYSSLLPKLLLNNKKLDLKKTPKVNEAKVKVTNSSVDEGDGVCPSYVKKLGDRDFCGIIRLGSKRVFENQLTMKKNNAMILKPDIMFLPDTYYDETKKFPNFGPTKWLENNDFIVRAGTYNKAFIVSSYGYKIKTRPSSGKRSYSNIIIKYKTNYKLYDHKTQKTYGELKSQLSVAHYAISWCGDTIIDTLYGEECEPLEKGQHKDGAYMCSNTCKIIK